MLLLCFFLLLHSIHEMHDKLSSFQARIAIHVFRSLSLYLSFRLNLLCVKMAHHKNVNASLTFCISKLEHMYLLKVRSLEHLIARSDSPHNTIVRVMKPFIPIVNFTK